MTYYAVLPRGEALYPVLIYDLASPRQTTATYEHKQNGLASWHHDDSSHLRALALPKAHTQEADITFCFSSLQNKENNKNLIEVLHIASIVPSD